MKTRYLKNGRMLNSFTKYASYLEPSEVRRIIEAAKDEKHHERTLLLWLGLRSGARLNELLLLKTEDAWDGYVPVWCDDDGEVSFRPVCKDRRELEWLRSQLEYYRPGEMVFGIKARSADNWIRTICKRAGIEIAGLDGYAAVVRPYERRKQEIVNEQTRNLFI